MSGTAASLSTKSQKKILKSPNILIVSSYRLKQTKISYANGRVSVRIFYKNNLICFYLLASSKSESRFIKLIRKKINHSATIPRNTLASSTFYLSLLTLLQPHRCHRNPRITITLLSLFNKVALVISWNTTSSSEVPLQPNCVERPHLL